MSSCRNTKALCSFSKLDGPIVDARREENQPFHGMDVSVGLLEDVGEGVIVGASVAEMAREAAGITFFASVSAVFLAGTDIVII